MLIFCLKIWRHSAIPVNIQQLTKINKNNRKDHIHTLWFKKTDPTIFSKKFNKYWSISIIFGRQNLKKVSNVHICSITHTQPFYSSGTTQVSLYQKVYFTIFWIFWCKMKITQADPPTIRMDCHPIQINWCLHLWHPNHFYARCPSWHNPPNLSWLGTGTNYAGLYTRWLGM